MKKALVKINTICDLAFVFSRSRTKELINVFLTQVYFTFAQSFFMIAALGFFIGIVLTFQAQKGLTAIGSNYDIGRFLVIIMFREVTPLVCSLIIVARSVTAVTAEIATMKVHGEIEALAIMGFNIKQYLILPRILAGSVSYFAVAVSFWLCSLIGSLIGINLIGYFPMNLLFTSIGMAISPMDIIFFLLKVFSIGTMIFFHAINVALSLEKASFEIPIVTRQAVIEAMSLGFAIQFGFSTLFYLIFWDVAI